ncbi:MAG: preprotein translocase subunit SecY [Helicobacteraceae bacterium]|jgi:preprotein translocase subunit SecY|nr:preprotein translocase subunit SecY [Helicobacteraceae bacterium]
MDKKLVNKILITLGFLLIFRLLAYVPTPGVDVEVIRSFFESQKDNALGLYNMFSGNAVERLSIISLGIMPYITAAIIMELLGAAFPELGKLKKERDGMQKYMQIVRYMTVGIALIQSIGVAMGITNLNQNGVAAVMADKTTFVALAAFSMTAGTMALLWIGEQITQKGIGNGTSLIIFGGIVAGIPNAIGATIDLVNKGSMNILVLIAIVAIILATVGLIIYVELAERRVPVSYSRKVMIESQNKRVMNYIPIKINLSGVIPPIFASALLMFPATILQPGVSDNAVLKAIGDFLTPDGYAFNALTFLLVIFFAYFYASIVFNPKDIAENLKRQGGFIPGVRPGQHSSEFLSEIASRLTLTGAIYLAIISTLPWVLVKLMGVPFYFGGTAVLIIVQVALDTMRKIEAQIYMSRYQTLSAVGL